MTRTTRHLMVGAMVTTLAGGGRAAVAAGVDTPAMPRVGSITLASSRCSSVPPSDRRRFATWSKRSTSAYAYEDACDGKGSRVKSPRRWPGRLKCRSRRVGREWEILGQKLRLKLKSLQKRGRHAPIQQKSFS